MSDCGARMKGGAVMLERSPFTVPRNWWTQSASAPPSDTGGEISTMLAYEVGINSQL